MKAIQILVLSAAVGASGAAWAHDEGSNAAANGQSSSAQGRVLLEKREVYVPVDANGHMVGNEMIIVEKDAVLPAASDSAWAHAKSGDGTTYVLVPDPKDSKNAPAPRFYVYRERG